MTIFAKNDSLTQPELDHLGQFLKNCKGGKAMNIEQLDGFFAALIAGPDTVAHSEYMPEVFGSETSEPRQFESLEEANEILELLMRHWNDIAGTLSNGKVYLPLLLLDENGVEHGNDWAHGFIRGTRLRHDGWTSNVALEGRRHRPQPPANKTIDITMPNKTKKTIVAAIVEKSGVKPGQAKQALETVLNVIKRALANGNKVELEKLGKLGKLKVVSRNPVRRMSRNLKNRLPTIETIHKKHPKTVRLLGGKDLSENPQPTIVHKPEPAVRRSVAIALPAWHHRIR